MTSRFPADGPAGSRQLPDGGAASRRVAVLVDAVAESEAAALDPLAPAQSTGRIIAALDSLGYEPVELSITADDPAAWLRRLIDGDFAFAFNLCETIGGRADGEYLAAAAVELVGLPMTGASAATLLLCLNKDRCSAILRAHEVNVPDWTLVTRGAPPPEAWDAFPAIVKPAAEDASNGVHPNSVVTSREELIEALLRLQKTWDKLLVQRFVEGREINLAIVGDDLLPLSEIDFSGLPGGSPPIVTFAAKWKSGSPEDLGTQPVCPAPLPPQVAEELKRLAARAWRLVDGHGYARVDVRLREDGVPFVIDINPNPDLSADAGLARQARVAGWSYEELIGKIVREALTARNGREPAVVVGGPN